MHSIYPMSHFGPSRDTQRSLWRTKQGEHATSSRRCRGLRRTDAIRQVPELRGLTLGFALFSIRSRRTEGERGFVRAICDRDGVVVREWGRGGMGDHDWIAPWAGPVIQGAPRPG